ncbi:MAG: DUF2752 domain-containing protein [Clostridia bacterium]|nr:DUF2752 domain-containing protein [Clostridia bacterium]
MEEKKRNKFFTYAAIAAALGLYLKFIGCAVNTFVGIPCPGCGLTRGALALLRMDFAAAWQYHPMAFLLPLVAAVIVFRKKPFFNKLFSSSIFWLALAVLTLAVYAIRMFLLFPRVEPMTINQDALLVKFILKGMETKWTF